MVTQCNNICLELKVIPPYGEEKYSNGRKFCGFCNCYFVTSHNRCGCCKLSLRNKCRTKRLQK